MTEDWQRIQSRRVLVAAGLAAELPDVPGLKERWGHEVLHWRHTHRWEARDLAIAVVGSFRQALLFRQLTEKLTLILRGADDLSMGQRAQLTGLGVRILEGEIGGLEIDSHGQLAGAHLTSNTQVPAQRLVISPRVMACVDFLNGLGVSIRPHPTEASEQVAVDSSGFTGVSGVWAAGSVSDVLASAPVAAAAGSAAATAINLDLLVCDHTSIAAAPPTTGGFSGAMEAEVTRRVLGPRIHGLETILSRGNGSPTLPADLHKGDQPELPG
ncbi:FAD-dependent oxidoreductase [Streptomyces sp. PTY087I2]|uniref:FAD-dependent oxidoreductase n=1 Tax=Streptomyces sp. PTY087I2 TaxID=1819298 RepID=UPI002100505B|nr:FAD-dependent oxidoreductase [Streptomyces sp. PTY087I2]